MLESECKIQIIVVISQSLTPQRLGTKNQKMGPAVLANVSSKGVCDDALACRVACLVCPPAVLANVSSKGLCDGALACRVACLVCPAVLANFSSKGLCDGALACRVACLVCSTK
jgi:hypothetical protein